MVPFVKNTNYSIPLSKFNAYQYRGCYSNLNITSVFTGNTSLKSISDMIGGCFDIAISKFSSFFGIQDGNNCFFGNATANFGDVDLLTDDQCFIDCGLSQKNNSFYLNSDKRKCGSASTVSVYQIQNNEISMDYRTDSNSAYGKLLLICF